MNIQKLYRNFLLAVLMIASFGVLWYVSDKLIPILDPGGIVGAKQASLIAWVFGLMLIVALPVFAMAGYIAWRYREGNHKGRYRPDYDTDKKAETIWWGIPIILIAVLGVMTWITTFELDPYKNLSSSEKPLIIQVVSLDWKWLFIYPDANIASVNYAQIPLDQSVEFHITSDSVMNSFWVPGLGSQMYTMPGMRTKLNLIANEARSYYGSSANISGEGFADMNFTVKATSLTNYEDWLKQVSQSDKKLSLANYSKLAEPATAESVIYYNSVHEGLFDRIIMQYMMPDYMIDGQTEDDKKSDHQTNQPKQASHGTMNMKHAESM